MKQSMDYIVKKVVMGFLPLCLFTFLPFSCRDHFDIDALDTQAKLVVYCFPSPDRDTTWISVTNSIPVRKYTDTRRIDNLAGARVIYKVNGQEREVHTAEASSPSPLLKNLDPTFYVLGRHQAGDRVSVSVACDGYEAVSAETQVPEAVPVALQRVVAVTEYDPSWYEVRDFVQLQATFSDPAASHDYYAVRVQVKSYKGTAEGYYLGENGEPFQWSLDSYDYYRQLLNEHPDADWHWTVAITDSMSIWPKIETLDEPLLKSLSSIDEDFGFENNFYGDLCIFADDEINGQTYTLHLNIPSYYSYNREGFSWGQVYQVVLYRISPEYYRFLKSLNDVDNNELAKGGFSQLMPTFSNMAGGLGVLGSLTAAQSQWRTLERGKD